MTPRAYAVAGPAYLAALLAVDTQVGYGGQLALGALTWIVLLAALRPLVPLARAQALGVVCFATVGEVIGSLVWGVYHYRLHNLPLFIPPAHGVVYLSGLALTRIVRPGAGSSPLRPSAPSAGGSPGSRCFPASTSPARSASRFSVSTSGGRARARRTPRVFLVVAALELYGTSIGTWRWARTRPRPRHRRREPAERRRGRLRVVRRHGAARRAVCSSPRRGVRLRGDRGDVNSRAILCVPLGHKWHTARTRLALSRARVRPLRPPERARRAASTDGEGSALASRRTARPRMARALLGRRAAATLASSHGTLKPKRAIRAPRAPCAARSGG